MGFYRLNIFLKYSLLLYVNVTCKYFVIQYLSVNFYFKNNFLLMLYINLNLLLQKSTMLNKLGLFLFPCFLKTKLNRR